MLVDVGVDGQHGTALLGEVAGEQRGKRGLPAAALTDERDLHRTQRATTLTIIVST
ncbi:hypothetical protein [Micromonospora sp. NPDC126480]|uniref:hypothetical protein n=1 Tax=Micromonospora sp. NPDC126480 TaxID=3155312 RepID=UPI0033179983